MTSSGAIASVHSAGSDLQHPSAPVNATRSPPQMLMTATTSKLWPCNGWNGWVTVKACEADASPRAIRAIRQRLDRIAPRLAQDGAGPGVAPAQLAQLR